MRNLKTLLYWNRWYICLTILVLFYSFFWIYGIKHSSRYQGTETKIVGRILSQVPTGQGSLLTLHGQEKIQVWTKAEANYPLGTVIQVTGTLQVPNQNTIFNQFNYKRYLQNHQIYYQMNAEKITRLYQRPTIIERVKQRIQDKLSTYQSKPYLRTFLLGEKQELKSAVKDSYQHNGISHLFALSGMHISFLTMTLDQLLRKRKKKIRYCLINGFLFGYVLLVGQVPSLYRAFLSYLFYSLNDYYQLGLTPMKRLCLVFNLVVLCNPYFLFDIGFQYSFVIVFFLTLAKYHQTTITHPVLKLVRTSVLAFLASVPLTIYYFSEINLMSPILNIFVVPYVTYLFFPLTLLSFFLPILDPLVALLGTLLEQMSLFCETYCQLPIIVAKPSLAFLFLVYGCLTLSFHTPRHTLLVTVLLMGNMMAPYFNPHTYMIFIDVGQGDSTLVVSKYNQCNLLIDTGGQLPKPSDIKNTLVMRRTIPLLKSLGITQLDYLILTHADYDHSGEADVLVNNFKVKHIITNEGAYHDEKIASLGPLRIAKDQDQLICGNQLFQFLSPDRIDSKENNNSLVITTKIEQTKVLWMADAEKTVEKRLLREYNLANWDILKVGHHGSNTSSSREFINLVNPKTSIISVGKNNRYHHPDPQVMNRLVHHQPYLTSLDGSIKITVKKQGYTIQTSPP